MMKPGKLLLIILITGLIITPIGVAGSTATGADKVKFGVLPASSFIVYFVAVEKGYFREQGLDVESVTCTDCNTMVEMLGSGHLDGAQCAASTFLIYETVRPGTLKIFSVNYSSTLRPKNTLFQLVARKGSGISGVAGLKGKILGKMPGLDANMIAEAMLNAHSLSLKDVETVELPMPLQVATMKSGKIDALLTIEPIPTLLVSTGEAELIERGVFCRYFVDPGVLGVQAMTTRFLTERPRIAKKFRNAIDRAILFFLEHEEEARKILPKYAPISEDIALKCDQIHPQLVTKLDIKHVQAMIDIYYQKGLTSKRLDASQVCITEEDFDCLIKFHKK